MHLVTLRRDTSKDEGLGRKVSDVDIFEKESDVSEYNIHGIKVSNSSSQLVKKIINYSAFLGPKFPCSESFASANVFLWQYCLFLYRI